MIFSYFIENNLMSANQSGFKPGHSCVNELLAIIHEIFQKLSMKYATRELHIVLQTSGSLETYQAFNRLFEKKKLFLTAKVHLRPVSLLVLPRFYIRSAFIPNIR